MPSIVVLLNQRKQRENTEYTNCEIIMGLCQYTDNVLTVKINIQHKIIISATLVISKQLSSKQQFIRPTSLLINH